MTPLDRPIAGRRRGFGMPPVVLALLLWSASSSLALGRRYVRPALSSETVMSDQASPAVDNLRQRQIQQLQHVYCGGDLLHEVQMRELFPDSKHFVDMPIKNSSSVDKVLTTFQQLKSSYGNESDWKERLAEFVGQNFDPPGAELVPISPPDFKDGQLPPRIAQIANVTLRDWAMQLHKLWKVLARVPAATSSERSAKSSFLHSLPIAGQSTVLARQFHGENILVMPGGRFRESYYWDSYWIVQGLLVSGMHQTARGVVNHLLEYVAEFGFVPNGGRIYYLTRSQPPMLSDMVRLVAKLDGNDTDENVWDVKYLRAAVPLLEREYSFWMHRGVHGHAVEIPSKGGDSFVLNRYIAHSEEPRPESYREDVSAASTFSSQEEKKKFYDEIIAGAESGWDFSSRWFGDYKTLTTVRTSRVLPVELNSILHRVERNLATFHSVLGNVEASERFREAARARVRAMDFVLYSEAEGCWKDYLLDTQEHSPVVSVADYSPLWGGAFDASNFAQLERVVASLERSGLVQEGGVQTTTTVTGQQWDAPNAWPPLQDIVVEGLLTVDTARARSLAKRVVQTWVKAGLMAWQKTGLMFEKYNAQQLGGVGNGGEYTPQFGFGWSNGAILSFLTKYKDLLDNSELADVAA